MAEDYYQKALEAAQAELAEKLRQKDQLEKRIAQLRQIIASLSAVSEETDDEREDLVHIPSATQLAAREMARAVAGFAGRTVGFTDAVREVLKASGGWMTPLHVKNGLIRMGIDIDAKYSNPLAVIHTTLKRLVDDNKEAERGNHPTEGTVYRWKTAAALIPPPKPALQEEVQYTRKPKEEKEDAPALQPRPRVATRIDDKKDEPSLLPPPKRIGKFNAIPKEDVKKEEKEVAPPLDVPDTLRRRLRPFDPKKKEGE